MPDLIASTPPKTASFLAVGAPATPDAAAPGAFAAALAKQITDATPPTLPQTGETLPAGRQDLAALPPATDLPEVDPSIDADADAVEEPIQAPEAKPAEAPVISVLAMLPRQPAPAEPVKAEAPAPASATARNILPAQPKPRPVTDQPIETPKKDVATEKVITRTAPQTLETHTAAVAVPLPAKPVVTPATARIATPVTPCEPKPVHPGLDDAEPAPSKGDVSPVRTIPQDGAPTTKAGVPADAVRVAVAPAPVEQKIEQPLTDAPKTDLTAKQEAVAVRSAPQPVAEARSIAFVMRAEPTAEPASLKPRQRAATAAMTELSTSHGTSIVDFRTVTATTAANAIETLPQDRAAALIETIQSLRSEMKGDTLNLAIDHADFGPISVRFERADDKVVVRFDTRDADAARAIADAAPELKASGEQIGMRFERHNLAGSNSSNAHDAPRHGRETARNDTPIQRPQSRHGQDRSGIYA